MEEMVAGTHMGKEYTQYNVVTFDQSLVFCAGAESFRVPRQAAEEQGTLSQISNFFKSGYNKAVSTANRYVESIKGLEIEDKLQ